MNTREGWRGRGTRDDVRGLVEIDGTVYATE